jgi:lipoyl(octanoyl) transferase
VFVEQLGLVPYAEAWAIQLQRQQGVIAQKLAQRDDPSLPAPQHQLLFVEHPHVYTLGKSGKAAHLLLDKATLAQKGIEFYPIERGGDITYHGPGQLVAYPIFDLECFFTDLGRYLRSLEEAVIRTLAEYGIEAGRYAGYTGVWLDHDGTNARKICAMGIKCSRWVTMHGLALNVNTDLSYFGHIVPCGISDKAVTSMQAELGRMVPIEDVQARLLAHLAEVFDFQAQTETRPLHLV